MDGPFDLKRGLGGNFPPRFVEAFGAGEYPAGDDQGLSEGTAVGESPFDEELIETGRRDSSCHGNLATVQG